MKGHAGLLLMAALLAAASADPLAHERWRHRVVVVFADAPGDPALALQRAALEGAEDGLRQRDVRVVEIIDGHGPADLDGAAIRAAFDHTPGFAVVLVGKDGGAKLRRSEPVSAATLFRTIDAMPMARAEAARRGGQ